MRVRVQTLRRNGQLLNRSELKDVPPLVGILRVREIRDIMTNETIVCANLLDPSNQQETDLLPPLMEPKLIWGEKTAWRLKGSERLKDGDKVQSWELVFA